jgi:hypothetical protein
MTPKRPNPDQTVNAVDDAITSMFNGPATAPFAAAQKIAFEGARFWARRMRAYADHLDALAKSAGPADFIEAQTRFIDRAQKDYVAESAAMADMMKAQADKSANGQAGQSAPH